MSNVYVSGSRGKTRLRVPGGGEPMTRAELKRKLSSRGWKLQGRPTKSTDVVLLPEGVERPSRTTREAIDADRARVIRWPAFARKLLKAKSSGSGRSSRGGSDRGGQGKSRRDGKKSRSPSHRSRGGKPEKKGAGNKTVAVKLQPELWERCKREWVKRMGRFSARAMQQAVHCYKTKCGDECYESKKKSKSNSMARWTREDWTTETGELSDGKRRYLPREVWAQLSEDEKRRTNAAKRRGESQWVAQPKDVREKTAKLRNRMAAADDKSETDK